MIGVSNFYPDRYIDIHHFAEIKPAVNQVETHVFQQQKTAKEYMKYSIAKNLKKLKKIETFSKTKFSLIQQGTKKP